MFDIRSQKKETLDKFNKTYVHFIEHPTAQQMPPSEVYRIIMDAFYNRDSKIAWPRNSRWRQVMYILMIPLTHLQWLTIPNPMQRIRGKPEEEAEKENYYPITLLMSLIWIWFYSGIIVWFTFDLTLALGIKFNVLPMLVYPFGIAMRDYKKFVNLRQAKDTFSYQMKD